MKSKIVVFLSSFVIISSFLSAAGFRFKNKTPFPVSVLARGKKTEFFHFFAIFDPEKKQKTSTSLSALDPHVTFSVFPGQTYFHDAGVAGFGGATVTFSTETLCDIAVKFNFEIPGSTGIRNWTLTGKTPEDFTLHIGPTGLDPEIGVLRGHVITSSIKQPCPGVE